MHRTIVTALLVAGLAAAGCLGDDQEPEVERAPGVENGAPTAGTFHFAPEGALSIDAYAGDERSPIGWSWLDWMAGIQAPTWATEPFDAGLILTGANVTVTYYAEAAAVFPDTLRPQFTVWFGVGADGQTPAYVDHGFEQGPVALLAGETHTVTFAIHLPVGGLAIEPGQRIVLPVASYYPDGLALGAIGLLAAASHVDWTGYAWTPPAPGDGAPIRFSGDLVGGRCVAPLNPEESAHARHPFEVGAEALGVDVDLQRVSGAGMGPDLDMFVQDAAGDTVAYAAGSAAPERIQIRAVNIAAAEPGTWTLNVYNCQPQVSSYAATVTVLAP